MPQIRVRIVCPYYLRLTPGEYQGPVAGESIGAESPLIAEMQPPLTPLWADFTHDETNDLDQIQRQKARDVENLLRRTNRLLRWYRVRSRRSEITEVTGAQVSPFQFSFVNSTGPAEWTLPFAIENSGPSAADISSDELSQAVTIGFSSGQEPDVADLFLLDAERSLFQGRFRETVLFCWSTIDSVFTRKYKELAEVALTGEWSTGRDFLCGFDFPMKSKMTAGLFLIAQRSLFREPGDNWPLLQTSYQKRNDIIHNGHTANEAEARVAIDVAKWVVGVMQSIPIPGA